MDLFDRARHQALTRTAWDADHVREAIAGIVDETLRRFDADALWPTHPGDAEDAPGEAPHQSLYLGAAGVIHALVDLRDSDAPGSADIQRVDWPAILRSLPSRPRVPLEALAGNSALGGEGGRALVLQRLVPDRASDELLISAVRGNRDSPTLELLAGAPGTTLAAWHGFRRTGSDALGDLYRTGCEQLFESWRDDPELGCHIWLQRFGSPAQLVGALHGLAGNLAVLLAGADLHAPDRREAIYQRSASALRALAIRADGLVNWPSSARIHWPTGNANLIQTCHGAPGMVSACAALPREFDAEVERLFREGGELVWRAGPPQKGPTLCHGTAGNGYALLELHRRTHEAQWLERARAFAMHALEQVDAARRQLGRGRFSLFTGDLGVALYLRDCLVGEGSYPFLQRF
jgi:hypothetical protein